MRKMEITTVGGRVSPISIVYAKRSGKTQKRGNLFCSQERLRFYRISENRFPREKGNNRCEKKTGEVGTTVWRGERESVSMIGSKKRCRFNAPEGEKERSHKRRVGTWKDRTLVRVNGR